MDKWAGGSIRRSGGCRMLWTGGVPTATVMFAWSGGVEFVRRDPSPREVVCLLYSRGRMRECREHRNLTPDSHTCRGTPHYPVRVGVRGACVWIHCFIAFSVYRVLSPSPLSNAPHLLIFFSPHHLILRQPAVTSSPCVPLPLVNSPFGRSTTS